MSSETLLGDGLHSQFTNIQAVFADHVLATASSTVFHRLDPTADPDQPVPACWPESTDPDWQTTDPETARRSGYTPCKSCYHPILDFLAERSASPVERRVDAPSAPTIDVEDDTSFEPVVETVRPTLTALTAEVLVQSSEVKTMHAPTDDGPLCDQPGEFRRVEPEAVDPHYRPCKDCFAGVQGPPE